MAGLLIGASAWQVVHAGDAAIATNSANCPGGVTPNCNSIGVGIAAPAQSGSIQQSANVNSSVTFLLAQNLSNGNAAQTGFEFLNDANHYFLMQLNSTGVGDNIFFGSNATGGMAFDEVASATMTFDTNNTQRILISAAGDVTLGNGNTFSSTGGAAPTLSAGCNGAGSSVTTGSTNNRGQLTTQTALATTCTITWSAAGVWGQSPFCVFDDAGANIAPKTVSVGACGTSTCVIDFVSAANDKFNWVCM
jgi:hypothetical protein